MKITHVEFHEYLPNVSLPVEKGLRSIQQAKVFGSEVAVAGKPTPANVTLDGDVFTITGPSHTICVPKQAARWWCCEPEAKETRKSEGGPKGPAAKKAAKAKAGSKAGGAKKPRRSRTVRAAKSVHSEPSQE